MAYRTPTPNTINPPSIISDLHIVHWNCRSLISKRGQLGEHIRLYSPDVIALQETTLKDKPIPNYPTYNPIRLNRTYNDGGGIAFYVKSNLKYRVKIIQRIKRTHIEAQCITIKIKNKELDIMNMYIPPNTPLRETELMYYIRQLRPNFVLCGDLNGHHTLWEPAANTRNNTIGNVIHTILERNNNINIATPPNLVTHTDLSTGKTSTIDLCLCSSNLTSSIKIQSQQCLGSDHYPTLIKLAVGPERISRGKRRKWIFDNTKWTVWQNELMKQEPKAATEVEEEVKDFTKDITESGKEVFKKSSNKLAEKFSKPWWNEECKKASALRKRAKRRMEKVKSRANKIEYRRLNAIAIRTYTENFRNFWASYLGQIKATTPHKELFDMVKKLQGKRRRQQHPLIQGTTYHYTKQEKAEIHNKYFKSTMTAANNKIYHPNVEYRISLAKREDRFPECNQPLTRQELDNAIENLAPDKAYGTDEVSNNFIKHLPHCKVTDLLGIYNRSWKKAIVPADWKLGLIIPIAKPLKDPNLPESYRPITLLQCLSKLLENLVGNRLNFIAEKHNLLINTQHGFRSKRQTLDPIVELEYEIRKGIAEGDVTVVVFFDLKAAYDSVDHKLLLNALAKLGIGGKLLSWIEEFLKDRYISTIVEDHISKALKITQGVPQGSGISCILFILLLSTLPYATLHPVKSKEYADDVAFSFTANTIEEADCHMQIAIDIFADWAKETGLTINTAKTKAMAFTNHGHPRPRLFLNNVEIDAVFDFCYLGITLDAPLLTWGVHIEKLLETCETGINLMKTMAYSKYGADRQSLLHLYCAAIKSKILYSTPALITTSETNINSLELIQNKALRIATGALNSTPIASLQCEANIPPLKLMIKEQAIKFYYKMLTKEETHPMYKYIYNEVIIPVKEWNWRARKPFTLKMIEVLHQWGMPDNPNLQARKTAITPPWAPLENLIYLNLITPMTKEANTPTQLRAESIRTIETRFPHHLRIYTDGSKTCRPHPQENSVAAAYYIETPQTERETGYWRMNPDTSIAGAELSAIHKALAHLEDNVINNVKRKDRNPKSAVILTDSKVSLYLIKQRKPKAYVYSTTAIQEYIISIREAGWNISLQWVPSHCDILGNEIADQTANEGHTLGVIDHYPIELEELKVKLKNTFTQQWANLWDIQKLICPLGNIKTNLGLWAHTRHRSRPIDVVMTRFRLNHTKLNKHMHMKDLKNTPNCEQCNLNTREDVDHVLLHCPKYEENRGILKNKLNDLGVNQFTVANLMGAADVEETSKMKINDEVANFLKKSMGKRIRDL